MRKICVPGEDSPVFKIGRVRYWSCRFYVKDLYSWRRLSRRNRTFTLLVVSWVLFLSTVACGPQVHRSTQALRLPRPVGQCGIQLDDVRKQERCRLLLFRKPDVSKCPRRRGLRYLCRCFSSGSSRIKYFYSLFELDLVIAEKSLPSFHIFFISGLVIKVCYSTLKVGSLGGTYLLLLP